MKIFSKSVYAAVAAVFLVAAPATAATLNVSQQNSSWAYRDASGDISTVRAEVISYSIGGTAHRSWAGAFRLTGTSQSGAVQDFLAFCLQPLEGWNLGEFNVGTNLSQTVVGKLGALMTNAASLITDRATGAAFQTAVWEIVTETSGAYDLNNGVFRLTASSANAASTAQSWLNNINTGAWTSNTNPVILTRAGTQDLLTTIAPVPLPAAGVMLLGGLAGMFGLRRRRKQA
jgi:hypothetical protein